MLNYDTLVFAVFYVPYQTGVIVTSVFKTAVFLHKYLLFYYRVYVIFPASGVFMISEKGGAIPSHLPLPLPLLSPPFPALPSSFTLPSFPYPPLPSCSPFPSLPLEVGPLTSS